MADEIPPQAAKRNISRWRRFSLRACFTFVTVVAIVAAWFGTQIARHHREEQAVARLTSAGNVTAYWASRFKHYSGTEINPRFGIMLPLEEPGVLNRLRNLAMFRSVVVFQSTPAGNVFSFDADAEEKLLIRRKYIAGLRDSDMATLNDLEYLQTIWLESNEISDEGLEQLSGLQRLEILNLQYTKVTDNGVSVFRKLPLLKEVNLSGTYVTDAAIPTLAQCRNLERIGLSNTNVTDRGVADLYRHLPNCTIDH